MIGAYENALSFEDFAQQIMAKHNAHYSFKDRLLHVFETVSKSTLKIKRYDKSRNMLA